MGVKGKLIGSIEVKCGGHLIHDILHTNPRHILNISPSKLSHFEMDHEGESLKIGSIVNWKYNDDGSEKTIKEVIEAIDVEKKSITWKVIGGDVLELYNSLSIITSCEGEWTTCTFVYDKKTEDASEPLVPFGLLLNVLKDIEAHHLK